MVPWIGEKYNLDVVTFTVDLGQGEDIEKIREKALKTGAVDAVAIDARNLFVDCFVWPALMAGALYEGKYPLATALGRPLIAKLMVDAAREHNAKAVAHGCTGKGNDQVRFDVTFQTLAPDLKIIAPVREWKMTRDRGDSSTPRSTTSRSRRPAGKPLQHRPEPLRPQLRGRRARRPVGRAAGRGLRLDHRPRQGPERAGVRRDRVRARHARSP